MAETGKNQMKRSMGLFGATGIGVGAIVGGGILALSGVAFATTGPGAILAFALNGIIAFLTVFSFAEMAAAFPESGGTYTFAKKVLSAPAAFMVGWVVWFASVVASVLYALGFAFYMANALKIFFHAIPLSLSFPITGHPAIIFLALFATGCYSLSLIYKSSGGGQWSTWGKVVIFALIIVTGFWYLAGKPASFISRPLFPFLPKGAMGLFQAMGYTFIALQGFDLIAAVAGEVKSPEKTIPRAMIFSLGIALAIYLPLLFVIATAGIGPGQTIMELSTKNPVTFMADAVQNYLGPVGFWAIMVAAILAMLSALRANLMAASRIALAMARDRALPRQFSRISKSRHTPIHTTVLSMVMVAAIILMIPTVAKAGAAASLIFLVTFALVHWTAILARIRTRPGRMPFKTFWFPLTHVIGAIACVSLAVFQGIRVPSAGIICIVWLGIGLALYLVFFSRRASVVDASAAALDPRIHLLRGRSPLVLVPIVNPANAKFMISVATAMAPPKIGRVLLLSVVKPTYGRSPDNPLPQISNAQTVLKEALTASMAGGLAPQTLITVAPDPWQEIIRVAGIHHCESLLLGLSALDEKSNTDYLERLMNQVDSDVVVLRASEQRDLASAKKVLVPVGGMGAHDQLRARILGSLQYMGIDEITFLQILPEKVTEKALRRVKKRLRRLAEDERVADPRIIAVRSNRPIDEIILQAGENDLMVLGLQRLGRRRKMIGDVVRRIAGKTDCGLILINRR